MTIDRQLTLAAAGLVLVLFLFLMSGGFWLAVGGGGEIPSLYLVNKLTGAAWLIEETSYVAVRSHSKLAILTALVYLLLGALAGAGFASARNRRSMPTGLPPAQ